MIFWCVYRIGNLTLFNILTVAFILYFSDASSGYIEPSDPAVSISINYSLCFICLILIGSFPLNFFYVYYCNNIFIVRFLKIIHFGWL